MLAEECQGHGHYGTLRLFQAVRMLLLLILLLRHVRNGQADLLASSPSSCGGESTGAAGDSGEGVIPLASLASHNPRIADISAVLGVLGAGPAAQELTWHCEGGSGLPGSQQYASRVAHLGVAPHGPVLSALLEAYATSVSSVVIRVLGGWQKSSFAVSVEVCSWRCRLTEVFIFCLC